MTGDGKRLRVLVTGGAGFIGSNMTHMLCEAGHAVTVLDDLSFGHRDLVDSRATFVLGPFDDQSLLDDILPRVDVVMHFAARSIIAASFNDPVGYFDCNVAAGIRLLEAMRRNDVTRMVFSSSAAVYGEPRIVPISEDDPKSPATVYGATKLAFEATLAAYYWSFGISSTSLRYFNAYGPGDLQEPVTRAVPSWIRSIMRGDPIVLYWSGQQVRDYVHVDDLCRAHLAAAHQEGLHVYNVGSGVGIRVRDLARSLLDISGASVPIVDGGVRAGDPQQLVASTDRIKHELGWRPGVRLVDGLAHTLNWFLSRQV